MGTLGRFGLSHLTSVWLANQPSARYKAAYKRIWMQHLFLDANTYLAFYSLPPKDLEQLGKLLDLIKHKKLTLYLPAQVTDEVRRNRARVIAELIKPLREARLQIPLPAMGTDTEEAKAFRAALADARKAHKEYVEALQGRARYGSLPADVLIKALFNAATQISDSETLSAAQNRKALGNPPGKKSSIGDAVNWETLLASVPTRQDLCLVSADSDFASPLDSSALDEFLADEWLRKKKSSVHFYREIRSFLDEWFPDIHLASDVGKYFLIDSFIGSSSFDSSHAIIAKLLKFDSFSLNEATRLLTNGLENSQVRWLARDDDMAALLEKVLAPHRDALPTMLVRKWEFLMEGRGHAYGPPPSEDDVQDSDE